MAGQETGNSAVLAVRACSPDVAAYPHYNRPYTVNTFPNHDEFENAAKEKVQILADSTSKMKGNFQEILNGPLKLTRDKPKNSSGMIGKPKSTDNADDMADIFISDEVLKQLMSLSEEKDTKATKHTKRKPAKTNRKVAKSQLFNNKEEPETNVKEHAKKILKPSLRRKSSLSISKSQYADHVGQMELRTSNDEAVGNKAENNNWLVDDEKLDLSNNLPVQKKYYNKSMTSYMDTVTQARDVVCKSALVRNRTSINFKDIASTNKEFTFKRADSSDDSGCFSNLSIQSVNSAGTENREEQFEERHMSRGTTALSNGSSANKKLNSKNSGLCNACGHETQDTGRGLCKVCIGRIKQDGTHTGALGELRAYAQSIADSVKKILSISPRQNDNCRVFASNDGEDGNKKGTLQSGDAGGPSLPQLYKCKTQISMVPSEEVRSKSRLNKSLSFDGRSVAAAHLDESDKSSSMYWVNQDKSKMSNPYSTVCAVDEEKVVRLPENVIDEDYFSSSEKDGKQYINHDEDRNIKRGGVERAKKKIYSKHLSNVERSMVDGDTVDTYPTIDLSNKSNVRLEHNNLPDFQRIKSRISRTAKGNPEKVVKNAQKQVGVKHAEEINALNVFRLKVIHEGSPVDPLDTVQRRKGEEGKDRRAAFMRSATAPDRKHMPKKESNVDDKIDVKKNNERSKTMNLKLATRMSKTSPLRIDEDSVKEMKKPHALYDLHSEGWREDNSVMAVKSFLKKRSTSYDNSKAIISKRTDLQKSISRATIERDNKGRKEKRRVSSGDKSSVTMNAVKENIYSVKNLPKFNVAARSEKVIQSEMPLSFPPSIKQEPFTNNSMYRAMEPYHAKGSYQEELYHNDLDDTSSRTPNEEEQTDVLELPNKSSYFDNAEYYTQPNKQNNQIVTKDLNATTVVTEHYYCDIEKPDINNQPPIEKALTFSAADVESVLTDGDHEATYHNQIQKYDVPDTASGDISPWYSSHPEDTMLIGRDRSHESKSSTSFHILTTVKSSHSDVALRKYQGSWDYMSSRRQSMYSETDVDTGLIYHFATRQTTRAHVPAYHDLTSTSKDIYTMSGDVSTSPSSNSGISTKSDVSDCIYTGGFFKRDPFYDNESKVSSSSSSADSSSHIYYEPCSACKPEPSELDIYTGALFSSSQNALSLANTAELNSTHTSSDTLQDGSTNNSTRPPINRMSRRLRYRPHIDVIKFKSTESANELLIRSMEPNNDILCNISNNSSSHYDIENFDDPFNQDVVVKHSMNSFYTDCAAENIPVFQVQTIEKPEPMHDVLKYDRLGNSANNIVHTSPSEDTDGDDQWYSGFSEQTPDKPRVKQTKQPDPELPGVTYSWQHHDDYYRSPMRQNINKTNNCNCTKQTAYNTNNNRFEELYTGFFETPNAKKFVPEEQNNAGNNPPDNWYAEQPSRSHSPTFFSDNSLPIPEYVSGSTATNYGSAERAYSTTSVFGQASAAYSESSTYMTDNGWREYDKNQTPSVNSFDESPNFTELSPPCVSIGEKYSYFPYASSRSPPDDSYLYDSDTYAFDERTHDSESIVREIRKVGGIVCRDNVVNKEDYAEDINRDLEQGAWMPFTFTHGETPRHQEEPNLNRSEPDIYRPPITTGSERIVKHLEENSYNQNLIYDNMGARNKWRELANMRQQETVKKKKDHSPNRGHPGGDSKRQEYMKLSAWNPPDNIPARALGKRPTPTIPPPTVLDDSKGVSKASKLKITKQL